jgi:hypothetical protein
VIAPVLAGESLKSAMVQARVVSDPLISNVQGWWLEYYLFYVRVGDLPSPQDQVYRTFIADPSQAGPAGAAASSFYYHLSGTSCPLMDCIGPVTRAYFRKEGEEWNTFMLDRGPAVRYAGGNGLQSLYSDAELGSPTGADTWAKNWAAFQVARDAKLTTNTWEEYLAQQGVSTPPKLVETVQDFQIPELVRFVRDFAYPVPTVDTATGTIRSTVQWSLAERIDKRRFFAEPGWLVGFMVARPKAYLSNQNGNLADFAASAVGGAGWIPPAYDTDPMMTMATYLTGQGPVIGTTVPTWLDWRDLYLYGDQFLNQAPGAPASGTAAGFTFVALPTVSVARKVYPQLADAQKLFVDNKTDGSGVAQWLHADGMLSLRIASRIGEATN